MSGQRFGCGLTRLNPRSDGRREVQWDCGKRELFLRAIILRRP
jgi:hypothetical protein